MTTFEHVQCLIGEVVQVNDSIWLYKEQKRIYPPFLVIVLGMTASSDDYSPPLAGISIGDDREIVDLFYPDGKVRSTRVVIGQRHYKDTLKEIQQ